MTSISLTRTAQPALTDRQVYRMLFVATFPIFFVTVLGKRVARALGGTASPSRKSVLAEAKDIVSSTLLPAFMG